MYDILDAKVEKHYRLLEQLWSSSAEYKSAIDMLSGIRKSHDRLVGRANALEHQQFADALKNACPPTPLVSDDPPIAPSMAGFQLHLKDKYLADAAESLSVGEGYLRLQSAGSTRGQRTPAVHHSCRHCLP